MFIVTTSSVAQQLDAAPTAADVKTSMGWFIDLMIWPFVFMARAWWYITTKAGVAILLSAVSAAVFTLLAMRHQAKTTRIRETFATINRDNWDVDVINARQILLAVQNQVEEQAKPSLIADYGSGSAPQGYTAPNVPTCFSRRRGSAGEIDFIEIKIILLTIMNDYENIALGIKNGILDEVFLYDWMKSTVTTDWNTLSPLVHEYRQRRNNPEIYVEFQGLASAWDRGRSFRTGNRLKKKKKLVEFIRFFRRH